MILTSLVGTVLTVAVATGPFDASNGPPMLTAQQKMAATAPLVRSATECIVRAVTADPRYAAKPTAPLGDLIVDSMPSCLTPVRAMIDAYDRFRQHVEIGAHEEGLARAGAVVADKNAGLLVPLRPDDGDRAHIGRIDDHDLILHHRVFVQFGDRVGGENVVGQHV